MKKKYSLMLAFLMMLGVAACGGSNESKDSSSTNNPINTSSTQISNNSSNINISTGKKQWNMFIFLMLK